MVAIVGGLIFAAMTMLPKSLDNREYVIELYRAKLTSSVSFAHPSARRGGRQLD